MKQNGFLLAILAIVIIAIALEFYPPVGWGLVVLAAMAMIGNYYARGTE